MVDAADALTRIAEAFLSGTPESRTPSAVGLTQLVVHVTPPLASAEGGASAEAPTTVAARLEDGTRLEPDALRRLGCDCAILPVMLDAAGLPIDLGRRSRIIRPALRRALEVRGSRRA